MSSIITIPHPKLRQQSQPVKVVDKKIIALAKDLGKTLHTASNPAGVGLSAVQIGILKRIFVTSMPKDHTLPMTRWYPNNMKLEVFIDPVVSTTSKELTLGGPPHKPFLEGCLSMPGLYGPVYRHQWLELSYITLDEHNEPQAITKRFDNLQARVVQHEYDHLEGKLFTDRSLEDGLPVYQEQGTDLVEIHIG